MAINWNELFESLGADPADWIEADDDRTHRQLHRMLFLRRAWQAIVPQADDGWIDREIAQADSRLDAPFAETGLALARLLASGAERSDLTSLVRGMQASLLFELAYLLSDPGIDDAASSILEAQGLPVPSWALVECDEHGDPTSREIAGLHESVLCSDPTGREMRPA